LIFINKQIVLKSMHWMQLGTILLAKLYVRLIFLRECTKMYMGCKRIIITFQWICTAVFLFYFSVKIIVETSDRNEN